LSLGSSAIPDGVNRLMDTSLVYLDAFLELPAELSATVTRLNRQIVSTVGGSIDFSRGMVPHITLYMGLFPAEELERAANGLAAIAADTSPIPLSLRGIEAGAEGYLFLNVEIGEPLRSLHDRIVAVLNPLRQGAIRRKFLDSLERFTPGERENIMNYGFPWLLSLFRPHVTIGKTDAAAAGGVARGLTVPAERGVATRLVLGEVGEHGTVVAARSAFDLSKAA